ncbi:hypothetical protein [Rhodanobacter sp. DHB23]|uniref:hypothetical protein n=1 Tax=Rhodanobacter sp. DHB23 TaxID=2775923 RepID=UPI00177C1446|nr:hypothetical protein [Rhodanobacter sp. DHB23]MBD8872450.1 hypothetical protein [Rhodanobacter sp. DHB23]
MHGPRRLPAVLAGLGLLLAAAGWNGRIAAQDAARPTGDYVLAQLDAARQALAQRTQARPDPALSTVGQQLAQIGDALRQQLGSATAQPVEILGGRIKGAALRANAAAQRTQAYLKASAACRGGDAQALATSLALAVDQLARAAPADKPSPPVIDAVETPDQQPLFVIHPADQPLAFVVLGANLLDAQCANPQLSLTDAQGRPVDAQPAITSITPQRIALTLANTASLKPGGYVLHVVPQRKAFLVGCTRQPEAVATLQVAPPLQVGIDYTLTASCRGQGTLTLGHGSLPAITRRNAAVSQAIDGTACANPQSYTVSATAHFGDGDQATVGPITQSADAGITAGLPGGMTLSWDPTVHMLFVRSGAPVCLGVD